MQHLQGEIRGELSSALLHGADIIIIIIITIIIITIITIIIIIIFYIFRIKTYVDGNGLFEEIAEVFKIRKN